jgi:hypothetical protein
LGTWVNSTLARPSSSRQTRPLPSPSSSYSMRMSSQPTYRGIVVKVGVGGSQRGDVRALCPRPGLPPGAQRSGQ